MMQKRKVLQKKHEQAVCGNLLRVLDINASFQRYGNDNTEPDILYNLEGRKLGIEVATAYYDNCDAKQDWTLAAKEREFPKEGYEERPGGVIKNPDKLICEKIQKEINDKCSKIYSGVDKIWLCIEERAPLSDENTTKECLNILQIPEKHQFNAIYLLHFSPLCEGGNYRAFKIYGD